VAQGLLVDPLMNVRASVCRCGGIAGLLVVGACSPPALPLLLPEEEPRPKVTSPSEVQPVAASTRDATSAPIWTPTWPPLNTQLEHFELSFGEQTAAIVYDLRRGKEYAPGWFEARGVTYEVELRQRGDSARYHPKLSWKVKLSPKERLDGARRLNFLAEWLDAGYLTDLFAYRLMAAAEVHAPHVRHVTLSVNGEYQGIYTMVEQVDKHFLRTHRVDLDGNVYRCGSKDCELKITPRAHYQKDWVKKTNEEAPRDDLDRFLQAISRTPEHELEAFLAQSLELEAYLRYMAVNALIGNHGIDDSGTYFVHDRKVRRWFVAPWDLNNSRMQYWRQESLTAQPRVKRAIPVYTAYDPETIKTWEWKDGKYGGAHRPFSVLNQRIWDRPALRHRALDYLEELMNTVFTPESADAQIDAIHAVIRAELELDPHVDLPKALRAPSYLKEYVRGRRAFLAQELPKERARGEGGVVINAIAMSGGTARDEWGEADGYIELYNRTDQPILVGGRVLTDVVRDEFRYRLPEGLVVPAQGKLLLWADGQPSQGPNHLPFRLSADGGELALLGGEAMAQVLDMIFYAPLRQGRRYGRTPDGAETWGWLE
jgi:spore coat protein H